MFLKLIAIFLLSIIEHQRMLSVYPSDFLRDVVLLRKPYYGSKKTNKPDTKELSLICRSFVRRAAAGRFISDGENRGGLS